MNGMMFGLLWMKRGYGISEEGRMHLRHMKLPNSVDISLDNKRQA